MSSAQERSNVGEEEEEEGRKEGREKKCGEKRRVMAPCLLPFLRITSSSPSPLTAVNTCERESSWIHTHTLTKCAQHCLM